VASSTSALCTRRVMAIDQGAGDYTRAPGLALGYPACCVRSAARVGDRELDAWATRVANRRFVDRCALTSPAAIPLGRAFLSYVPCSSRCVMSRVVAETIAALLWPYRSRP